MHSVFIRRIASLAIAIVVLSGFDAHARQGGSDRPRLSLKANPKTGRSPARIVLTAELTGGSDDYAEFYCPTVQWEWGDGTESEATMDCEPYEAGKSTIKRRFTVEHVFRGGNHAVSFRLKRQERVLATATVQIQVQPGIRDIQ